MIRLLYITNGLSGSGGLERVLSLKASYLADRYNYKVHIITLNEHHKKPFYNVSSRVAIHNLSVESGFFSYLYQYFSGIRKKIRMIKPDVISVCDDGMKGFLVPVFLRKRYPVVYERHAAVNLNFDGEKQSIFRKIRNKLFYQVMNICAKSFDSFVVLTKGNLESWKSRNLLVIPNPISFFPDEVAALKEERVIAVGSHSYNKGYDLLLKAWEIVVDKHPAWHLDVYGKIDVSRIYIEMAGKMQLSSNVSFHEPVSNIQDQYLNSSIMVLPSRSEGFGMVLIEAMACGVPCVAFDCPFGPADILNNEIDGFLVEKEDYMILAEKIILLIENNEIRMKMGVNARERAQMYQPGNVIPRWDQLFSELTSS